MKLMAITEYDLLHRAEQSQSLGRLAPAGPYQHAIRLVLAALETVNQAGLDGKRLSDLEIIEIRDPETGNRVELHAKVTHRLAKENPHA